MKRFEVPGAPVYMATCWTPAQVRAVVEEGLSQMGLPSPGGMLFLKPCVGTDRIGLLGGSTDLRVLVALIETLKDRGYHDLMLGDTPLPPYLRAGVAPWRRLRLDRLVRRYNLRFVDINVHPTRAVALSTGTIHLPRVLEEALALINLANVRTHPEAGLAMGAWNLKGLVASVDRPVLIHHSAEAMVALSRHLRPHFTLLDALVAMEGEGPLDGTPCRLERLFFCRDVLTLDLVAARLFGYTPEEVPHVWHALYDHALSPEAQVMVEEKISVIRDLRRPHVKGAAYETSQMVKGWVQGYLRRRAESTGWRLIAERFHLRYQVDTREDSLRDLSRDPVRCDTCRKCEAYCPVGLKREQIGALPAHDACIQCLYCFAVCDRGALSLQGEGGALLELLQNNKGALERL